jgi:hypothetical protein
MVSPGVDDLLGAEPAGEAREEDLRAARADAIELARRPDGSPFPWAAGAVTALRAAAADADREANEAAAADARYRELQATARTTGDAFDLELQRFRRSLAVVLGRNHPDFQKLRGNRAWAPDADDEEPEPAPSTNA